MGMIGVLNKNREDKMIQIEARTLALGYGQRTVLREIDLSIRRGEFISIIGPSGVGKSTLLMAINASIAIFEGELRVLGEAVHNISNGSLKKIRSRIGVIFQGFNLVRRMTVLDNIASGMLNKIGTVPALIKYYTKEQYEKMYEYIEIVGLEEEALKRCDRLSGGQMQRVAIARALAQEPEIILADEPISSLDPVSAKRVMETLKEVNDTYKITVVSNLHQLNHAKQYCNRVIGINRGRIVYNGAPEGLDDAMVCQIYHGMTDEGQRALATPVSFYPSYAENPV